MRRAFEIVIGFFVILLVAPLAQADLPTRSFSGSETFYLATVIAEALFLFVFLNKMISIPSVFLLSFLLNTCSYPILLAFIYLWGPSSTIIAEALIVIIEAVLLRLLFNFFVRKKEAAKRIGFLRSTCISLAVNGCSFFIGLPLFIF